VSDQELSVADRIAIADLYNMYSFLIDAYESEQLAELFTEDSTFELPGVEPLQGRAGVVAFVDGAKPSGAVMRHFVGGVVAKPAPFGAVGRAYLQAYTVDDDALRLLGFGEYNDDLVRSGSGWLFKTRRFSSLVAPGLTGRPLAEALAG
jgi:hypothetical protein